MSAEPQFAHCAADSWGAIRPFDTHAAEADFERNLRNLISLLCLHCKTCAVLRPEVLQLNEPSDKVIGCDLVQSCGHPRSSCGGLKVSRHTVIGQSRIVFCD